MGRYSVDGKAAVSYPTNMNISMILKEIGRKYADRTALASEEKQVGYPLFLQHVNSLSRWLIEEACPNRGAVLYIGTGTIEFAEILMACMTATIDLHVASINASSEEIGKILEQTKPEVLFLTPNTAIQAQTAIGNGTDQIRIVCTGKTEFPFISYSSLIRKRMYVTFEEAQAPDSKISMWFQGSMIETMPYGSATDLISRETGDLTGSEVNMLCIPLLSSIYVLELLESIAMGKKVLLISNVTPKNILRLAAKYSATETLMTPGLISLVYRDSQFFRGNLHSIRTLRIRPDIIDHDTKKQIQQLFEPTCTIILISGSGTEERKLLHAVSQLSDPEIENPRRDQLRACQPVRYQEQLMNWMREDLYRIAEGIRAEDLKEQFVKRLTDRSGFPHIMDAVIRFPMKGTNLKLNTEDILAELRSSDPGKEIRGHYIPLYAVRGGLVGELYLTIREDVSDADRDEQLLLEQMVAHMENCFTVVDRQMRTETMSVLMETALDQVHDGVGISDIGVAASLLYSNPAARDLIELGRNHPYLGNLLEKNQTQNMYHLKYNGADESSSSYYYEDDRKRNIWVNYTARKVRLENEEYAITISNQRTDRRFSTEHLKGLLTKKELTVLEYVASGAANLEIANNMGISVNTVKFHLSRIFEKLGVNNRTELLSVTYLH